MSNRLAKNENMADLVDAYTKKGGAENGPPTNCFFCLLLSTRRTTGASRFNALRSRQQSSLVAVRRECHSVCRPQAANGHSGRQTT